MNTQEFLQPGVQFYDVSIHIEAPVRDKAQFLPSDRDLCHLLKYGGVDPDTRGSEWQTYRWGGTFSAMQLAQLLDAYAVEDRETDENLFDVPGFGQRVVECLDFHGGCPGPFLNDVTILEGLDESILTRVARPYVPTR